MMPVNNQMIDLSDYESLCSMINWLSLSTLLKSKIVVIIYLHYSTTDKRRKTIPKYARLNLISFDTLSSIPHHNQPVIVNCCGQTGISQAAPQHSALGIRYPSIAAHLSKAIGPAGRRASHVTRLPVRGHHSKTTLLHHSLVLQPLELTDFNSHNHPYSRFLRASGLSEAFPAANVRKSLRTIYDNNVLKFGHGRMGAVNGFVLGDKSRAGRVDYTALQSGEMWTGVTYGLAALMIYEGAWITLVLIIE